MDLDIRVRVQRREQLGILVLTDNDHVLRMSTAPTEATYTVDETRTHLNFDVFCCRGLCEADDSTKHSYPTRETRKEAMAKYMS